jgi:hypothetical protein
VLFGLPSIKAGLPASGRTADLEKRRWFLGPHRRAAKVQRISLPVASTGSGAAVAVAPAGSDFAAK